MQSHQWRSQEFAIGWEGRRDRNAEEGGGNGDRGELPRNGLFCLRRIFFVEVLEWPLRHWPTDVVPDDRTVCCPSRRCGRRRRCASNSIKNSFDEFQASPSMKHTAGKKWGGGVCQLGRESDSSLLITVFRTRGWSNACSNWRGFLAAFSTITQWILVGRKWELFLLLKCNKVDSWGFHTPAPDWCNRTLVSVTACFQFLFNCIIHVCRRCIN